jgi:membrane-associated phospholipid phosphatase
MLRASVFAVWREGARMTEVDRSRRFLLAVVLLFYPAALIAAWIVGLAIDLESFLYGTVVVAVAATALAALCRWRALPTLGAYVEVEACGLLVTAPIIVSVYAAHRLGYSLADEQLLQMDAVFGVDWVSMIRFVDMHPALAHWLNIAYASFGIQLLLLPIILCFTGQVARAYQMVSIYGVICAISSVISIWFPALGTYAMHNVDPDSLRFLNGRMGVVFLGELNAVRSNPDFVLSLARAEGIMTFPSVHAAVAMLCAWAAWHTKWLRLPIFVLCVLMATSAAIVSNHYIVDIVAGFGVAGVSISSVLIVVRGAMPRMDFANVLFTRHRQT